MGLVLTPFGTRPNAGADLDAVYTGTPPLQVGQLFHGSDGHNYRFVRAGGAAIAKNTAVTVADATWIATAGAGGWKTPVNTAVPANAYFWARSDAVAT